MDQDSEEHIAANARHHAQLQALHAENARLDSSASAGSKRPRVRIASFGGLIPRRQQARPGSGGSGSSGKPHHAPRLMALPSDCATISPPQLLFSTNLALGLTPMTQQFALTGNGACPNTVVVLSFAVGGAGMAAFFFRPLFV